MVDIREFLIQARKVCYTSGASPAKPALPNSYDMLYKDGALTYRSSNIGGLDFNFLEVIWEGNKPIWSMNVSGRVISDGFNGGILKEALLEIDKDFPFRGPQLYVKGEYMYISKVEGNLSWFTGREEIYYQEILIYEGNFHGGSLS